MITNKTKAFFLDRDGIINIDTAYVGSIKEFVFCDGIFDILKYLQEQNFMLFIITNQSGIGRGYFSLDDFNILNTYMLNEFRNNNINIQEVKCCPHSPEDNCECRKPKPMFLNELINKYSINTNLSWFVGDKTSDIQCGINANIKNTILINKQKNDLASYNFDTFSLNNIKPLIN
jgi:D-glycero-D-manno-heptose 1,7-bisphosphate phosphatase